MCNTKDAAKAAKRAAWLQRRYGPLYSDVSPLFGDRCAYCGDAAEWLDYVPSLEAFHAMGRKARSRAVRQVVPACEICIDMLEYPEAPDCCSPHRLEFVTTILMEVANADDWSEADMRRLCWAIDACEAVGVGDDMVADLHPDRAIQ